MVERHISTALPVILRACLRAAENLLWRQSTLFGLTGHRDMTEAIDRGMCRKWRTAARFFRQLQMKQLRHLPRRGVAEPERRIAELYLSG